MTFQVRMAERAYKENKKLQRRDEEASNRKDGPSHVWQARLKQVEHGETRGLCAETKRLWQEAGMEDNWPPLAQKDTRRKSKKSIQQAAKKIMEDRLKYEMERRSEIDGDTPYRELFDGTTWRITNGDKREVGLGSTARLGALMTTGGRAADGNHLDPTCACCRKGRDTARHVILKCKALKTPRNGIWEMITDDWTEEQQDEFESMTEQQQYMTLLGKQMKHRLDMDQQRHLDTTMKRTLVQMDDIRQNRYDLPPMNGTTHNRPPEQSIQMAELWREMKDDDKELRRQAMNSDTDSDTDSDTESQEE
jgi:hypothetical protein